MLAKVFTILGLAAATTLAAEVNFTQYLNETLEFVQDVKQYSRA